MSLFVSLADDLHMKNSPQKYVKKDEILAAPIRIYMKNAIVFSQSDMRNFFTIKPQFGLCSNLEVAQ